MACCGWPASEARDAEIRALAAQAPVWPAVLALVARHRVAGLVRAALAAAGVAPPREAERRLAMETLDIRRQNLRNAAETVRLQARFDAAGIPAVFFKGTTLGQQAYASQDLKHSKDIDVIVPPEHLRRAAALLEEDGYLLWQPRERLDDAQWRQTLLLGKEVALCAPDSDLQVELHWRLARHPRLLAGLDANAATVEVDLPGFGRARAFAPEDLFACLCVHGTSHAWARLKWLADLQALVAGHDAEALRALHRHAGGLGVGAFATVALELCRRLWGLDLPDELTAEIAARPRLRRLVELSLQGLQCEEPHLGWVGRLELKLLVAREHGYLGSQLWRASIGHVEPIAWPLPRPLHGLYILTRLPLFLWRRATRTPFAPPPPTRRSAQSGRHGSAAQPAEPSRTTPPAM
ncbi:nucleotidyltransferase family protein [Ancylobacter lacus]|uniref:nucleotidyltransferase family protein n=1 Tax=Ancylobacter lacus TaxID=2579970 RepID=UPI001BCF6FE9|nr:nucleotidyltransferase family protein [Ancylobacter lacus]